MRGEQSLCVLFFRPIGGDDLASYQGVDQGVEIKKEAGTGLGRLLCNTLRTLTDD